MAKKKIYVEHEKKHRLEVMTNEVYDIVIAVC